MIRIDDSLFAHITNDAYLEGTYALQGQQFSNTIGYLKQYIESLPQEEFPPAYTRLLQDLRDAVDIEALLQKDSSVQSLKSVADNLVNKVLALAPGEMITLPGGWQNQSGGHAMLYQLIRTQEGFEFNVINSGDGIERYHHRLSSTTKELYSPVKTWSFPTPETEQTKNELNVFIYKLLQARTPQKKSKKVITAQSLYDGLIQKSMSFLHGQEIEPKNVPDFAYTGGQLSGTCAQRCLDLLLLIHASDKKQAELFLFKYMMFALQDYYSLCKSSGCNEDMKQFIVFAIRQGKHIISTEGLFSEEESKKYEEQLNHLSRDMEQQAISSLPANPQSPKIKPQNIFIKGRSTQYIPKFNFLSLYQPEIEYPKPCSFLDGVLLLENLLKQQSSDGARQFLTIKKTVAALYNQDPSKLNFEEVAKYRDGINLLQGIVQNLQKSWLTADYQLPEFNIVNLLLTHWRTQLHDRLSTKDGMPSYQPFIRTMMRAVLGNQARNPFLATNNRELDQQFIQLQAFYSKSENTTHKQLKTFFKTLLETQKEPAQKLKEMYKELFGEKDTPLHLAIRKEGLEALYMMSLQCYWSYMTDDDDRLRARARIKQETDDPDYKNDLIEPLVKVLHQHLEFEKELRRAMNPWMNIEYSDYMFLKLDISEHHELSITSTLSPLIFIYEEASQVLNQTKFGLGDSVARDALMADYPVRSDTMSPLVPRTSNHIQLHRNPDDELAPDTLQITHADVANRNFYYLRLEPSIQIELTLEYFIRNIHKLADENNQRYLEANLMQPSLSGKRGAPGLINKLMQAGIKHFTQNGKHTRDSLFLVHLEFLLATSSAPIDVDRLNSLITTLKEQLNLKPEPDLRYFFKQYLFLSLCLSGNKEISEDALISLLEANFYINSHTNPRILDDLQHNIFVEETSILFHSRLKDTFKANKKYQFKLDGFDRTTRILDPNSAVYTAIKTFLEEQQVFPGQKITSIEYFEYPIFTVYGEGDTTLCDADIKQGKLYDGDLARSSMPILIQNHPLIEQLGFKNIHACMINNMGDYLYFYHGTSKVHIVISKGTFTVQKEWTINGTTKRYELQALSKSHLAYVANPSLDPVELSLPDILSDGNMNYWQNTDNAEEGFLTLDNQPIYYTTNANDFVSLDTEGNPTPDALREKILPGFDHLYAFENQEYLIMHESDHRIEALLPRYQLSFVKDKNQPEAPFVIEETQEALIEGKPPIQAVSGLRLKKGKHERYLVPLARFYPEAAQSRGGVYPFIHDTENSIPESCLENFLSKHPVEIEPLWRHRQSASYVSFRLKNDEVIADSLDDSLYLAYLHLGSNKPFKAWNSLNECVTRFGGLKGESKELELIRWILQDLPYIAANGNSDQQLQKNPVRNTPPYIVCQLKALSLLCDLISRGKQFNFEKPTSHPDTANDYYARLQLDENEAFLNQLKQLIREKYTRFQNMQGDIPAKYSLSILEKKRLLNVLFQDMPDQAHGSLGWEWVNLGLESVVDERDVLKSNPAPTVKEKERLDFIEQSLRDVPPVMAQSTRIEKVSIDLSMTKPVPFQRASLSGHAVKSMKKWLQQLEYQAELTAEHTAAIQSLSSSMKEDTLVHHLQTLFQIATMPLNDETSPLKLALEEYCLKVLRASHFAPHQEQKTNKELLCAILYRNLHSSGKVRAFLNNEQTNALSLDALIELCTEEALPPVFVYKPVTVYEQALEAPQKIRLQEQRRFVPLSLPKTPSQPFPLTPELQQQLNEILVQFKKIEAETEQELERLGAHIPKRAKEALQVEKEAGKVLYNQEVQFNQLAQGINNHPQLIQALRDTALSREGDLAKETQSLWEQAILLANEGPEDPIEARKWNNQKEARTRLHLSKKDLMSLFVQADYSYYYEKTHLSQDKVQKLHECIHKALVTGKQLQCTQQIKKALKTKEPSIPLDKLQDVLQILVRDDIPVNDDPSIILLQHEQELLLRKRQTQALEVLLETKKDNKRFNEVVEKIIMGGGKSKVILPIIAEKKAHGDNLVVVEVPQAFLATNYVDLNQTSQRLFGKNAFLFEFNRDSDISPQRLKQFLEQFKEVMSNRSYMVTTGESVQALELKYIELLIQQPQDELWKEQVYWYDQIIKLFNNQADCFIDEVHLGLWIKKKLNFTLGLPESLNQRLLSNAAALFSMIDRDWIKKAPSLPNDFDWAPFQRNLATRLVRDKTSPLHQFIERSIPLYGSRIEEELIQYLTNQAKTLSPVILEADPASKLDLAFFKQEISKLLPLTLSKKLDKNYGASRVQGLSPVEQTLAIPYVANNTPNERSRFGNELEAINYTAQMLALKGITFELMKERVEQWKALASAELHNFNYKSIDETPIAHGFNLLTQRLNLRLSQVNTQDQNQMERIHECLKYHPVQIAELLKDRAFNQIKKENATLTSDAFNHKSFYRSVQGVSGTPSNAPTFHQDLQYNRKASLGSDGYILELIKSKNTTLFPCDYVSVETYVSSLLKQTKNRAQTRAIVDIKAAFQGVHNLEVAQALAAHIKQLSAADPEAFVPAIKHILYFNERQVLCALSLENPPKITTIGRTDTKAINRILNSKPEERFTYYDQAHTQGMDIEQASKAHALVLVDEKTSLQEFLQGSMRMRKLNQNQSIEIVVPERLKSKTLDDLCELFPTIDIKELAEDMPSAVSGMMANILRSNFIRLISDLPSLQAEKKAALIKQFEPFFIHTQYHDLFALYGGLDKKFKAGDLLAHSRKHLISLWESCMEHSDLKVFSEEDILRIKNEMSAVIDAALPYCLEEYETIDEQQSKEVELQTEIHKQTEIELVKINECYDPTLVEAPYSSLIHNQQIQNYYQGPENRPSYLTLNQLCALQEPHQHFSERLYASINYAQTYENQTDFTGVFLKPVFMIWYHMEQGQLHAMIITHEDFRELRSKLPRLKDSWIATTNDTVLAGCAPAPDLLKSETYQSLREQVRFFSGEFEQFINQDKTLYWLNKKPMEKIAFYAEHLLKPRAESEAQFHQLSAILTQAKVDGFIYICEHPFHDFSQFKWQNMYPDHSVLQIESFQRFAKTLDYINHHLDELFDPTVLMQSSQLPLNSLVFLNKHRQKALEIRTTIQKICATDINSSIIENMSQDEERLVAMAFGCTKDELQFKLKKPVALSPVDKDKVLILMLCNHPLVSHDLDERLALLFEHSDSADKLFDIMKQIKKPSPAVEDAFDKKLMVLLEQSDSSVKLFGIVKHIKEFKPDILACVFRNPHINDDIVSFFLENPALCDEALLKLALSVNIGGEIFKRVLKNPHFNDSMLEALCTDKETSVLRLRLMLEERPIIAAKHRLSIWFHPNVQSRLRETLLHPPVFDESFLVPLLDANQLDTEYLNLVLRNNNLSLGSLEHILKSATHPSVLSTVIEGKKCVSFLSDSIKKHPCFTPEIALQLNKTTAGMMQNSELEQHIASSMKVLESEIKDNITPERRTLLEQQLFDSMSCLDIQELSRNSRIFTCFTIYMDLIQNQLQKPELIEALAKVLMGFAERYGDNGAPNLVLDLAGLFNNPVFNQNMIPRKIESSLVIKALILKGIENHLREPVDESWDGFIRKSLEGAAVNPGYYEHFVHEQIRDINKHLICLKLLPRKITAAIHFPCRALIEYAKGTDKELIELILKLPLSDYDKTLLAKTIESEALINTMLRYGNNLPESVYAILFGKREFNGSIYQDGISSNLIINYFDRFNERSKDFLEYRISEGFSARERLNLVHSVSSAESINYLLKLYSFQTYYDTEMINILIEKENYNGMFKKEWDRYSPECYKRVINKTKDFDSLMNAIQCLKKKDGKVHSWLVRLQEAAAEQYENAQTPQDKYNAALEGLKLKSFQHALKTPTGYNLEDAKHYRAAKTAFDLYHKLKDNNPLNDENPEEKIEFCHNQIKEAQPILSEHRGYKQAWLNIINAVIALFTGNLQGFINDQWLYLCAETETTMIANRIIQPLDTFRRPELSVNG